MARVWQLLVRADGDTRAAQREMRKLQRSVRGYGKSMQSFGRGMTMAVTAPILAGTAVGLRELQEQMRVTAATEAVLRSTGKAGQISAKQVEQLTTKFEELSGIEDDVIQSSENVLLRFDGINKHNFERVSRSMLDMMASGKDGAAAATALGVALSKPSKAAGRLAKMGLVLNDTEKRRIKTLLVSHRMGKAQALILRRVERAYRGQAEALGDTSPLERIKRMFENLTETLAKLLLPHLLRLGSWLRQGMAYFQQLSPHTQALVGKLLLLGAVIGPVALVAGSMITAFAALLPVLAAIGGPALLVIAALAAVGVALGVAYAKSARFRAIVHRVVAALVKHKTAVLAVLFPLGAFAAWLVRLYQRNAQFRQGVQTAASAVVGYVKAFVSMVSAVARVAAAVASAIVRSKTFKAVLGLVKANVVNAVGAFRAWGSVLAVVVAAVMRVAGAIGSTLRPALGWIKSNGGPVFDGLKSALSWIDNKLASVLNGIESLVSKGARIREVGSALGSLASKLDPRTSRRQQRVAGMSAATALSTGLGLDEKLFRKAEALQAKWQAKLQRAQDALSRAQQTKGRADDRRAQAQIDKARAKLKAAERIRAKAEAIIRGMEKMFNRFGLEDAFARFQVALLGGDGSPGASQIMFAALKKQYEQTLAYLKKNLATLSVDAKTQIFGQLADLIEQIRQYGGNVTVGGAVVDPTKNTAASGTTSGAGAPTWDGRSRMGRAGSVVNVYPQSQDVEAIARRVAFLLANGRVSAGGMA